MNGYTRVQIDDHFLELRVKSETDLTRDRMVTLVKFTGDVETMEKLGNSILNSVEQARREGSAKRGFRDMDQIKFRFDVYQLEEVDHPETGKPTTWKTPEPTTLQDVQEDIAAGYRRVVEE